MDAPKSFHLSPEIHAYIVEHGMPPDEVQRDLISETKALGGISLMQISPEQGAFMTLLTRAIGARRAIEVGTFTGYSALCIARGLPDDGRLLCCDVSEQWTNVAKRHWERAGVASKIDLQIAPALDTLRALPSDPVVDLAFIDADKPSYPLYYEEILRRLRPGGLLLVDNVLWMGTVVDPKQQDEGVRAIRAFNDLVARDERVERVMIPLGDGLTIVRKR